MFVNQNYGLTFQMLCQAKEINISKVAKKTGIAKSTLSKFVNGTGSLNMDQMDAALESIHVDLSEYDFYLNHFQHNYAELYFSKIDKAAISGNIEELENIYNKASHYGERMFALCAKARLKGLEPEESVEICSFILGLETFTFYELAILSDTISEFSLEMIDGVIKDLKKSHKELEKRSRYRQMVCQIACRAAMTCAKQGQSAQRQMKNALGLAEKYCHEKDVYSRQLFHFAHGYCSVIYGESLELKQGLEEMRKVIEIFSWEGSENLARVYQDFYDENITNAVFPLWFRHLLDESS